LTRSLQLGHSQFQDHLIYLTSFCLLYLSTILPFKCITMPLKLLVLLINFHLPGISFYHGKDIESLWLFICLFLAIINSGKVKISLHKLSANCTLFLYFITMQLKFLTFLQILHLARSLYLGSVLKVKCIF
jgi:hypothetical protein